MKWVHGRYIKNKSWWDYTPPQDASWYWKKICRIKEVFKSGCDAPHSWTWQGDAGYTVSRGYAWLRGRHERVPWAKSIWARSVHPKHAFICWILAHNRLPTKKRLGKYMPQTETTCSLCSMAEEDEQHLFLSCPYANAIWRTLREWWKTLPEITANTQLYSSTSPFKGTRTQRHISYAILAAAVYCIWSARNHKIFKHQRISPAQSTIIIKEHVKRRVLFLNSISGRYSNCIDALLS